MALGIPPWAWARCEVRHSQNGWPKARLAFLEHVSKPRGTFKWTLADGLSAGPKIDRALDGCRFSTVPAAIEWMDRHEWSRNIDVLRQWDDLPPARTEEKAND